VSEQKQAPQEVRRRRDTKRNTTNREHAAAAEKLFKEHWPQVAPKK